jgi:hypothetical protein
MGKNCGLSEAVMRYVRTGEECRAKRAEEPVQRAQ